MYYMLLFWAVLKDPQFIETADSRYEAAVRAPVNIVDSSAILRVDRGFYIVAILWAPLKP